MYLGLWLLTIGTSIATLGYTIYRRNAKSLSSLEAEDLVSYYLELAIRLLPWPFWAFVSGIILILAGIMLLALEIMRYFFF